MAARNGSSFDAIAPSPCLAEDRLDSCRLSKVSQLNKVFAAQKSPIAAGIAGDPDLAYSLGV
jgi:hypothetical protein